jgi:hypothetical protein
MIDRLGKLGDKGESLDKLYNKLLVPSAASEWDIGRLGSKKEVSRKLLGRLSAYARMFKLSEQMGDERISTTFLSWLSGSNHELDKPRKQKAKKGRANCLANAKLGDFKDILLAVTAEPMCSKEESDNELEVVPSSMTEFLKYHDSSAESSFSGIELDEVKAYFAKTVEDEQGQALEGWLQKTFVGPIVPSEPIITSRNGPSVAPLPKGHDVACILLKLFSDLERKTECLGATVVKWVPVLSVDAGSPELWTFLFSAGLKPGCLWSNLMSRCCQSWSHDHVAECRDWILLKEDVESLDLEKVVRFFVQSISWSNVHTENFMQMSLSKKDKGWGFTEESVRKVIRISVMALTSGMEGEEMLMQARSRNNPPEALVLLLLLSRFGRKHVQLVSQTLVESLNQHDDKGRGILLASVLRVYACYPQHMNLGVAVLRAALKEAVEKFPMDWLSWRSPMDDVFEDLMTSLVQSGVPGRDVQALVDDAKKHPLLILRKLGRMEELLGQDASSRGVHLDTEKPGAIVGGNLTDIPSAKVEPNIQGGTMNPWGYNYTDIIWISFLDIVTSGKSFHVVVTGDFSHLREHTPHSRRKTICCFAVHNEVLFGCGLKMGLDNFIDVYLRLVTVQSQPRTSERLTRLKGKLSDFFAAFKASNRDGWDEWLVRDVNGLKSLGSARKVLLRCDLLSHQEAVDSVKNFRREN